MKSKNAVLLGAVLVVAAGALSAWAQPQAPASAPPPEKACLQNNRLWGFDVIDERTLTITDRTYKRYTVHMTSGCVGLTKAIIDIELRSKTALGCLERGDRVFFRSPGLGRLSCFVTEVENYRPPAPKEGG